MAILSHIVDHRRKGLRVHVVIMAIHERDTLVAAQVVKCLLELQPETLTELAYENQRPFQFVILVICHILYIFATSGCKVTAFF